MSVEIGPDCLDLKSRVRNVKLDQLHETLSIVTIEVGTRIGEHQAEITIHGISPLRWVVPHAPIRILVMPGEEE